VETSKEKKYKKLFGQGMITFGTHGLRFLLRFGKNAIIARLLGPSYRGILSLITLIPTLLTALGNLGFGQAIVYYVAKKGYDVRNVMGTTLVFMAGCSISLVLLGWGILHFPSLFREIEFWSEDFHMVILAAIPMLLLFRMGQQLLIAKGRIFAFNSIGIADSFIPLVLLGIFLVFGMGPFAAAVLSWIIGLLIVSVLPYLLLSRDGFYPPRFDRDFLKKGAGFGFSSHLANVFQMALFRIDFIFVSAMLGPAELGYYAVATAIAETLFILPESIGVPFVPILFGSARKESDQMVPMVVKVTLVLLILVCLCMAAVGRPLIGMVFGADFLPAFPSLVWLLPGVACVSIFPIFRADLFSRKMPGRVSAFAGAAMILNLILNPILIPAMGIEGAALSSSIAYALLTGLAYLAYARQSGNSFGRTFFFSRSDLRQMIAATRGTG